MKPASLTRRLTAFFTLGTVALLLALGASFMQATDQHFLELDQALLESQMHLVRRVAEPAQDVDELRQRLQAVLDEKVGFVVAVHALTGELLFTSDAAFKPPGSSGAHGHAGMAQQVVGAQSYHVLMSRLQPQGERPGVTLTIGLSTFEHDRFMRALWWRVSLYMALAAALATALGWLAARQGLKPLRWMRDRLQGVTAQQLHQELPVADVPEELVPLAQELNAMMRRLQADFQRLSDFSADLAHELRTPLSNLLTQTQVALSRPRSNEDYGEVLASNAEELDRLGRMVSDMLLLAKMEHGIELPHAERFDLHSEFQALLDFYEALAEELRLSLTLSGQARVKGDRLMLRRAVSNLLSNALRHANSGSAVSVDIQADAAEVRVVVSNFGPEIPAEDQARLFDRFFRADPARAHVSSEGAGLGLAITHAIAKAHGGQLKVQSANGVTRFILALPQA